MEPDVNASPSDNGHCSPSHPVLLKETREKCQNTAWKGLTVTWTSSILNESQRGNISSAALQRMRRFSRAGSRE